MRLVTSEGTGAEVGSLSDRTLVMVGVALGRTTVGLPKSLPSPGPCVQR